MPSPLTGPKWASNFGAYSKPPATEPLTRGENSEVIRSLGLKAKVWGSEAPNLII